MAKSADAADLKSAGRKAVGVQVPLRAPENKQLSAEYCLGILVEAVLHQTIATSIFCSN